MVSRTATFSGEIASRVDGMIRAVAQGMKEVIRTLGSPADQPPDPRALKIVAKSIYRELSDGGFRDRDVMVLASELLDLVTSDLRARRDVGPAV